MYSFYFSAAERLAAAKPGCHFRQHFAHVCPSSRWSESFESVGGRFASSTAYNFFPFIIFFSFGSCLTQCLPEKRQIIACGCQRRNKLRWTHNFAFRLFYGWLSRNRKKNGGKSRRQPLCTAPKVGPCFGLVIYFQAQKYTRKGEPFLVFVLINDLFFVATALYYHTTGWPFFFFGFEDNLAGEKKSRRQNLRRAHSKMKMYWQTIWQPTRPARFIFCSRASSAHSDVKLELVLAAWVCNAVDHPSIGEPSILAPCSQGLAISNSETIRSVHNGFSRQEPFFRDDTDDESKNEDAFHFVAYVPHGGKVGIKAGLGERMLDRRFGTCRETPSTRSHRERRISVRKSSVLQAGVCLT